MTTATLQITQAFTTEKVCFPQGSGHILSFTFDLLMQLESNSSGKKEEYIYRQEETCGEAVAGQRKECSRLRSLAGTQLHKPESRD